jgi:glycopeptide antibiotics resistance protein
MKGADSINKTKYILVINIVNMLVFLLIEYLHLIFKLGIWDNNDMIASLIGIILSTVVYFGTRKEFVKNINNLTIG